jgi:hypothetical protein
MGDEVSIEGVYGFVGIEESDFHCAYALELTPSLCFLAW